MPSNKTTLSVSTELRELIRANAELHGVTMERATLKAVAFFSEFQMHNPNTDTFYNALRAPLTAAQNEMATRYYSASKRSRRMCEINRKRREANRDKARLAENRPSPNTPTTSRTNPVETVDYETWEPSESTQRRMIQATGGCMPPNMQ